jgi:hypothetical protein
VIELKKRGDSIAHVCVVPRSEDEDEAAEAQEGAELQATDVPTPETESQTDVQGEFDFNESN